MADTRRFALGNQLVADIEQLVVEAQQRWLRPAEICEILRSSHKFRIASESPNMPPSGSLFLFDRKVVRHFSKDGHNWGRKNDGRAVEEAHKGFKVGGSDVLLHCSYAHGLENENFQRRSYWMLEQELSHIVLVHYREVKTSKNDSSHLSNRPSNQKLYSDSAHDLTSRSHKQALVCDDLLNSLQPSVAHPNRVACSKVQQFAYRANHGQDLMDIADNYGNVTTKSLCMRFAKLLSLRSVSTPNCEPSKLSDISQLKSKISSLLKEESDLWNQMVKLTTDNKFSLEEVKEKLLQKQLKEKLHAWLLQKAAEGGKALNVLDDGGQGMLHFAAALGYDWALYPTVVAGVNINFCDVSGWTALHWAVYCGRERTVASLLALGAAPGALSYPTPKYPSGLTPADLASSIGCIGLAGYLAELDLRSLLSAINLNKVHNAAKISARIHQVLQMLSFQLKEYGDDTFRISDECTLSLAEVEIHKPRHHDELAHAAAIKIQNTFRSWKCRKDFLIIRQQIVKIQALVRGHHVRKSYKKTVWSLGSLDMAMNEGNSSMVDIPLKEDDFNFLKEDRKQAEERLQKPLSRVMSMVQYPETTGKYQFNGNTLELQTGNYHGMLSVVPRLDFISPFQADKSRAVNAAGFTDEPMIDRDSQSWEYMVEDFAQGVGSETLHPSSASSQYDTPKQGHETWGQLSSNSFGEWGESGGHLTIHGESQGTTSTQSIDVASKSVMDYTNEFTNDKIFESKKALIQWTRDVGKKNGFVIVIKRSDLGNGGQKARITFCCERGGQHRNIDKNKLDKKEKDLRNIDTKKCGCPFTLKGQQLGSHDNWILKVVYGVHNHPITKTFEGRSYAGTLSKEENSLLVDMSKSKARPKDILVALKNRDVNNVSTIKDIYNARQRYKVKEMVERSHTQQLLSKLSEYKYIKWHKSIDNTDISRDLFWAHPASIELLHAFPHVLLMDCACKSNRFNLPLFEIVGVTSTNMTFAVAFAHLESEQEDNYVWALERLRSVMDDNALPIVILTDKELTLMNAIERVFPTTKHLLSRWQISRNVSTNCKKMFARYEIWKKFLTSWNAVVVSSNEDELMNHLNTLKQEFSSYPQAIQYVTNTWLNNYKERFVSVWTDKIMHFGYLTQIRVGRSHSMLKKELHHTPGNFKTSWTKIHSLLGQQRMNIIASFEKSLTVVQDHFKPAEFKELRGFISIDALHMVLNESKRANSIGVDASTCGCMIRCTHGLPCAHKIAEFRRDGRPIPLESIHSYWRKLDLVPVYNKQKAKLHFDEGSDDTKLHLLKKLTEIANPQSMSLMEPKANKEIHGLLNSKSDTFAPCDPSTFEFVLSRQENCSPNFTFTTTVSTIPTAEGKRSVRLRRQMIKANTFISSFPIGLRPYIHHIKDVAADGNCGFRAVADLMSFGENGWLQVRMDLLNELKSNLEYYGLLYRTDGTDEGVEKLIHALSYFESFPSIDGWMIMPDMGHLIASAYNVILFQLSLQQCLTFLPLKSLPMPTDSRKHIAIGFVNNNHFVEVFLTPDHPVPPIATDWYKFRYPCAKEWETAYISRIEHFKNIINNDVARDEMIIDSHSAD